MVYSLHKKVFTGRKLLPEQRDQIAQESASKMMNSDFSDSNNPDSIYSSVVWKVWRAKCSKPMGLTLVLLC